jgi:hypothetical protein
MKHFLPGGLCNARTRREEYEKEMAANVAFVRATFPNCILKDAKGFYWANLDGDRFYFDTWESAAEDFAAEIAVTDEERASVA